MLPLYMVEIIINARFALDIPNNLAESPYRCRFYANGQQLPRAPQSRQWPNHSPYVVGPEGRARCKTRLQCKEGRKCEEEERREGNQGARVKDILVRLPDIGSPKS